jgi:hypothetical protein
LSARRNVADPVRGLARRAIRSPKAAGNGAEKGG